MALVSDKFVFFHMPRTGGSWVRRVISRLGIRTWENGHGHSDPSTCDVSGLCMFTVMREREPWMRSWRKFREANQVWTQMPHPCLFEDGEDLWVTANELYQSNCTVVLKTETLRVGLPILLRGLGYEVDQSIIDNTDNCNAIDAYEKLAQE